MERLFAPFGDATARHCADALIAEFGSLGAALSGSAVRVRRTLARYPEVAAFLPDVRHALALALMRDALQHPHLPSAQALLDYLHLTLAHLSFERVQILHLSTRHRLIRQEIVSNGTIDEAAVYIREVMRRCLELGSASIIMVHNHPGGDPTPSRADIDITRRMAEAGKRLNVVLYDHIIIGEGGHSSLRALGLL
jgi:DNA repair protein RadC